MSRKSTIPQTPRHVLIFDEDWEFLKRYFGPQGIRPIGVSPAIRAMIHKMVTNIRQRQDELVALQAQAHGDTNVEGAEA